jgi:uncharacterized protein with GYD domain
MATFIMLSRLSPEGMKTLKGNPERLQEVNREVEGFGARVVQQYALLGEYDFITVLEAPDPETVSRVSVELSSRATARYETLTAISVEEFVSRIRGEGSRRDAGALQQQAAARRRDDHPTSTEEPARREEEVRREEAPPPSGREERAGQQQERGREEERSLLERARDAVTGGEQEEEEPRREEEPGRREAPPRRPREDEPPPPPWR